MRIYPVWLVVCTVGLLVGAIPANAANRPPRPIVKSHGVKVKAGYVGQCPRRENCAIPDVFVATEPVPVHPGGVLRINARRPIRRLRMDLDCPYRRLESTKGRVRLFELPDEGCSIGELLITYRRVRVTYTFNLERHEHCQPEGWETVAENVFARIYTVEGVNGGEPETRFFACRLDSDRSKLLGREYFPYSGQDFVDHIVLANEKVAYVTGFQDYRYGPRKQFSLRMLDMATFTIELDRRYEVPGPSGAYDRAITAVVLKANGSVAWILNRTDYGVGGPNFTQTYEVHKSDTSGADGLIDSSPDIDPTSLALNGSVLTWTRSGETQSATLD
jgi:hypothetical protein